MYLGYKDEKIKFYTEQPLDTTLYGIDRIEETDKEYVLDGEQYILKDEAWEEKQAQKEAERIAMLNLTAADVERAIYKTKGIDFDDVIALVEAQAPEGLDIKALKIEFKANNFYRGNPYIDVVGTLLGFTTEQLDKFFETKDYHELLPVEEENGTEQASDASSNGSVGLDEVTNANTTDTTESDISI